MASYSQQLKQEAIPTRLPRDDDRNFATQLEVDFFAATPPGFHQGRRHKTLVQLADVPPLRSGPTVAMATGRGVDSDKSTEGA